MNAFTTGAPCRFHQVGTRREPGGEPEEPPADHRAFLPGYRRLLQRVPTTAAQRLPLPLPGTLRPHLLFAAPPESLMPLPQPPSCSLSLSAPLFVSHFKLLPPPQLRHPNTFQIAALYSAISPLLYLTCQHCFSLLQKTPIPLCSCCFFFVILLREHIITGST